MALATVNRRFIAALGPMKIEFLNVTSDDTNTVVSNLANPLYAIGVNNEDADTTSAALNVTLTTASKVLTINNANLSTSEVNILVFGF